jgi:hypothetical protein
VQVPNTSETHLRQLLSGEPLHRGNKSVLKQVIAVTKPGLFMVVLALDCQRRLFNNLGEWAVQNSFFNLSLAVARVVTRQLD